MNDIDDLLNNIGPIMADTGLRGAPLLAKAVKMIELHPEQWDQSDWITYCHCYNAYCIGAWCILLTGRKIRPTYTCSAEVFLELGELLGISTRTVQWLCQSQRSFDEIRHFSETLTLGFDDKGWNRDGFDWEGYHRDSNVVRA